MESSEPLASSYYCYCSEDLNSMDCSELSWWKEQRYQKHLQKHCLRELSQTST